MKKEEKVFPEWPGLEKRRKTKGLGHTRGKLSTAGERGETREARPVIDKREKTEGQKGGKGEEKYKGLLFRERAAKLSVRPRRKSQVAAGTTNMTGNFALMMPLPAGKVKTGGKKTKRHFEGSHL